VFLSSWWALGGAVVGWLGRRGLTGPPVVASVWVLIEAGRGRVPFGGFPWGEIGYAFHDVGPVRALAGWGGVALVSWMAVAFNGWLLDAGLAGRESARRRLQV
jgi:apolipoprotein N-acyltransferase